jgi:hypothetical protein
LEQRKHHIAYRITAGDKRPHGADEGREKRHQDDCEGGTDER